MLDKYRLLFLTVKFLQYWIHLQIPNLQESITALRKVGGEGFIVKTLQRAA